MASADGGSGFFRLDGRAFRNPARIATGTGGRVPTGSLSAGKSLEPKTSAVLLEVFVVNPQRAGRTTVFTPHRGQRAAWVVGSALTMRAQVNVRAAALRASTARFFSGSANPAAADGGGGVRRRFSPARPRRGSSRNYWQWQTTRARLDVAVRPETYREEMDAKIERARAHFAASSSSSASDEISEVSLPETEVFESARSHFRMRAEFRVWHEGDTSFLAMFDSDDPKTPIEVPQFPMGSEKINELMPALLAEIEASETLRKKLFQVNFLTTVKGEAMISMLYHRRLTEAWESEAEAMRARLGVSIVGRSRKQKVRRRRPPRASRMFFFVFRFLLASRSTPRARFQSRVPPADSPRARLESRFR